LKIENDACSLQNKKLPVEIVIENISNKRKTNNNECSIYLIILEK